MNFGSFPDPFGPVASSSGAAWGSALQGLTANLYLWLLIFEIVILGVQSLFFKDSVIEYIKTFAGKVILATVVVAVISRANLIFPQIVSVFAATAQTTIAGTGGSGGAANSPACVQKLRWTCVPPQTTNDPESTLLKWSVYYFVAADASRVADSAESIASGIMFGIPFPPDPGNGDPGLSAIFLMGHGQFQMVCFALGMICVLAAGTIYLTYVLLTFEAQIVLAIGVIMLAGYGSRFTKSMSNAFPKYCVTIGTKFFAFYFVVAVVEIVVQKADSNELGLLAGLVGGALVPFGFGAVVLLVGTSAVPIISVISAVLIAAIPNFAASLTQGGSALSAGSATAQIGGSFSKG